MQRRLCFFSAYSVQVSQQLSQLQAWPSSRAGHGLPLPLTHGTCGCTGLGLVALSGINALAAGAQIIEFLPLSGIPGYGRVETEVTLQVEKAPLPFAYSFGVPQVQRYHWYCSKNLNHANVVLPGVIARIAHGIGEVNAISSGFFQGSMKGEGCFSALVRITATGSSSSASTAICAL